MAFGLLTTGFAPMSLQDVKASIEADLRAAFGQSIDLAPEGPFGQLVGIVAERYAELWDVAQALYSADDPNAAVGQRLAQICAITGTYPRAATKSTVTLTLTGDVGTVVPAGSVASVEATGVRFDTTVDSAAFAAATAWVALTPYVVGDRRKNSGNVYRCEQAGTSAASGGPTGTDRTVQITDASCKWRFLGAGDAYADVAADAEDTGPLVALANTCTTIVSPVAGWDDVTNVADAVPGRNADDEPTLRARRVEELPGASRSTVDAIRNVVSQVPDVTHVTVFENTTDSTNADGMPPHSVEVLARGGIDQAIVDAVFDSVAAGIATTGNQTGTHVDLANGNQSYTIKWSRPTEKDTYVIANVVKDPLLYPADGDAQVLAAILAVGAGYEPGKDVVARQLVAAIFAVPGVLNVPSCYIGLAPAPASEATIPIALRELAVLDSARTTVNSSDGVP